ncbi:aminotransferase class I/II-fold pyridoxal phosphate-dependent enzyme [Micromonospora sp. NPDC049081]|uniref:DegT/DnrJ/EryC1/StrS family aminotransferase n=1 Tax=Micromonospora sp. NPDC049081 TaxID=3155150 RepID=UPI00340D1235
MTAGPLTTRGGAVEDLSRLLAQMPRPAGTEYVAALEDELAARFEVRHAVAVSSGTAALHTALLCLGIGPGDEVLVPALSVVMSVAPIIYAGARPVFVDCDRHGCGLDLDDLTAKVTGATKAILTVHLWGRQGDPTHLARVAAAHGLAVIEDACQAQGSSTEGRVAGTNGDVGCFSLKDGKILWCGEGGYLLTDRDDIASRARALRAHHLPLYGGQPETVGYNYRLAEPLAVLAHANLARFDELLDHRRQQARQLAVLLTATPGITATPTAAGDNGYSALIRVDLDHPRAFCEHLAQLGVPNSVGTFGLMPADRRPAFARYAGSPCRQAATVIDRTLAVVLTDHDTEERINGYAQTISREASTWATHP